MLNKYLLRAFIHFINKQMLDCLLYTGHCVRQWGHNRNPHNAWILLHGTPGFLAAQTSIKTLQIQVWFQLWFVIQKWDVVLWVPSKGISKPGKSRETSLRKWCFELSSEGRMGVNTVSGWRSIQGRKHSTCKGPEPGWKRKEGTTDILF